MKRIISWIGLLFWTSVLVAQSNPGTELPLPEFSQAAGFYDSEIKISMTHPHPNARIYFTINGSIPKKNDYKFSIPITLVRTTVIRAVAEVDGQRSGIATSTFFIKEPHTDFPIISISLEPNHLFHYEYGLFVKGPEVIDDGRNTGANYWSRREVPMHTEMFESDKRRVINQPTGFRVFGGMSRQFPQKSFAIVADKNYGKKRLKHTIFPDKPLRKFKHLILRNSGSDFGKTQFRDVLITNLVKDENIEVQAHRPALCYINGKYWGLYNIREKINRHFIASNNHMDKDSLDLIEHYKAVKRGTRDHYKEMQKYMHENDMSKKEHFDYIKTQMDVDNFLILQVIQIYIDNKDAGGNIKFWRSQSEDGLWRWVLYDTDWGFGLHNKKAYKNNTLKLHTASNGPSWPNPPWSTYNLRHLLKNKTFEHQFVNTMADVMNTAFEPDRVLNQIDSFSNRLMPELPRHWDRWNLREKNFNRHVERMKTFAVERPPIMRQHLDQMFNTGKQILVQLEAKEGGKIILNNHVTVDEEYFSGVYFKNYPITIEAVPHFGYSFSHWENIKDKNIPKKTIQLEEETFSAVAVFKRTGKETVERITINEICKNHPQAGDWMELYNPAAQPVNLRDWVFIKNNKTYSLPEIIIPAKEYAVLAHQPEQFKQQFSNTKNIYALPFKIGDQLIVELFSSRKRLIDSVGFQIRDDLPKDSSFTLSLTNPLLSNSDLSNWDIEMGEGTPGLLNKNFVPISKPGSGRRSWWIFGLIGIVLLVFAWLFYQQNQGDSPGVQD